MRVRTSHKYFGNKKRSQVSEKDLAKKLGGRVQPASGAINRFDLKADVKSDLFLSDDKVCGGKSFSVTTALWKKLSKEAWKNSRRPLLRINFSEGEPVYVMDELTFLELLEAFNEKEGDPHVLTDRSRTPLFVKLTFTEKAKKPQWEQTETLCNASVFPSKEEAETAANKHKVPDSCGEPVEYELAYLLAMKRYGNILAVKPEKTYPEF